MNLFKKNQLAKLGHQVVVGDEALSSQRKSNVTEENQEPLNEFMLTNKQLNQLTFESPKEMGNTSFSPREIGPYD